MCGIFCTLGVDQLPSDLLKSLSRRGPDNIKEIRVSTLYGDVLFVSSVLHLRGDALFEQPAQNPDYVFQWNGEVFGGIPVGKHENDTDILFRRICSGKESIEDILASVQGPYAFTLLDVKKGELWFGRDALGRRSLVMRTEPYLQASSVIPRGSDSLWKEVEVDHIYCYNLTNGVIKTHSRGKPRYLTLNKELSSSSIDEEATMAQFHGTLKCAVLKRCVLNNLDNLTIGILFSGGIDSTVLAILAAEALPAGCTIDLFNVAFEQNSDAKQPSRGYNTPDRLTGIDSFKELKRIFPNRHFNFVQIDVSYQQYMESKGHVSELMKPNNTVMDLSIAAALWWASTGNGLLHNTGESYTSPSRVVIVGAGADEQLGGYSRHRTVFERGGEARCLEELQLDLDRIPYRNLGRDDRCISDHGKEARFPFLDEEVVAFLSGLPIRAKINLSLPRGVGEKLILRKLGKQLGLPDSLAYLPKRAIQFGAKTAKIEGACRGDDLLEV